MNSKSVKVRMCRGGGMDWSAGNTGHSPTDSLVIAMRGSHDGLPLHDDTDQSVKHRSFCLLHGWH